MCQMQRKLVILYKLATFRRYEKRTKILFIRVWKEDIWENV